MISEMIEKLTWIMESNPMAFGHPASEEDIRDEEDLAGFYMRNIIDELKTMANGGFIKSEEKLPTIPHDDWDYDSTGVIGVIENDFGTHWVKPVRYERTKVRGKRVERWTDWDGRLMGNYKVIYWRPFPEFVVEEPMKG